MSSPNDDDFIEDFDADEGVQLLSSKLDVKNDNVEIGVDVNKLIKQTVWEDSIDAFHQAKYALIISIIIICGVAYYLLIGQYRVNYGHIPERHTWDTLKYIRPVVSKVQQSIIYENLMQAETTLQLPNNDAISFKFQPSVNKYGSFQLPEMFYQGVCFSIGLGNTHNVDYASTHTFTMDELFQRLKTLKPTPMYIAPRYSDRPKANSSYISRTTKWDEQGYMVYYSYKQLDDAGLLSMKTPTQPWLRVSENLLEIAREFKQMYITVYYANAFGPSTTNQVLKVADKLRKQRELFDKGESASTVDVHALKMADDEEMVQRNVYYLSRSPFDGSSTHSVDYDIASHTEIVEQQRRLTNKGPKITPKFPMSSSGARIDRSMSEVAYADNNSPEYVGARGMLITDKSSVMRTLQNDYMEHGSPRKLTQHSKGNSDPVAEDTLRDQHKHKYETVIQEVIPAYTGLDAIRSKCAVWLSKFNHETPAEIILNTFETLNAGLDDSQMPIDTPVTNDKDGFSPAHGQSSHSRVLSFLKQHESSAHRMLVRTHHDNPTRNEVSLPFNPSEVMKSNQQDDELFQLLMSSEGYNHINKMDSNNVVYRQTDSSVSSSISRSIPNSRLSM